jgi:hypothetical protein
MVFILRNAIPVLELFIESARKAADWFVEAAQKLVEGAQQFYNWVKSNAKAIEVVAESAESGGGVGVTAGAIRGASRAPTGLGGLVGGIVGQLTAPQPSGPPPNPPSPPSPFPRPGQPPAPQAPGKAPSDAGDLTDPRNSLRLVIESFRRSAAPPASFAGIAERSRRLQLESLNRDPLQQIIDKRLLEVIAVLGRVEAKLGLQPQPRLRQEQGGGF